MKNHQIVAMSLWFALCASAQVKTEVPPVVPRAKPVAVEHIKVHGAALEGNLEKDAVDRDVTVFLPPRMHASSSFAHTGDFAFVSANNNCDLLATV